MSSYPLNEVLPGLGCPKSSPHLSQELRTTKPQTHPQEPLRCPRCDSSNTKFCYYNNYSLSQPRYFCKGCRRYWTKGGTLRNVPVGGGCRKNKRPSSSSPSPSSPATASSKKFINFPALPLPPLSYDPADLSLTFSNLQNDAFLIAGGGNQNPGSGGGSFLDILKTGLVGPADPGPAVGGFPGLYYGFGVGSGDNGAVLPPFNHGGVGVRNSTGSGGGAAGNGSYWNAGSGASSWQSFINGFPHEIHDGGA